MIYLKPTSNYLTTKYYYEMIESSLRETFNEEVIKTDSFIGDREDIYVVGNIIDAFSAIIHRKNKVFVWLQGILPEESFYRRQSKIRFFILSKLEKYVLKKATGLILVSNAQEEHYELKYKLLLDNKVVIVPCFNTQLKKESFSCPNKYQNNIFTYTGSLTEWQCFEETVSLYKKIENKVDNSFFKVLTPNIDEAKFYLDKYKIKNYSVNFVESDKLDEELKDVKYGFVLRKDNPVNNVSTPTKLSTYISNGIIPIMRPFVKDFTEIINFSNYKIISSELLEQKIIQFVDEEIDYKDVLKDYNKIFDEYYSRNKCENELCLFFKGLG